MPILGLQIRTERICPASIGKSSNIVCYLVAIVILGHRFTRETSQAADVLVSVQIPSTALRDSDDADLCISWFAPPFHAYAEDTVIAHLPVKQVVLISLLRSTLTLYARVVADKVGAIYVRLHCCHWLTFLSATSATPSLAVRRNGYGVESPCL